MIFKFNKNRLKYLLSERGLNGKETAAALQWSRPRWSSKLSGLSEWKLSEIYALASVAGLSVEDINSVFFIPAEQEQAQG